MAATGAFKAPSCVGGIVGPRVVRRCVRPCGALFTSVAGFDRHRYQGTCRPPRVVDLVPLADGTWGLVRAGEENAISERETAPVPVCEGTGDSEALDEGIRVEDPAGKEDDLEEVFEAV